MPEASEVEISAESIYDLNSAATTDMSYGPVGFSAIYLLINSFEFIDIEFCADLRSSDDNSG